jgi:hypothetical protein
MKMSAIGILFFTLGRATSPVQLRRSSNASKNSFCVGKLAPPPIAFEGDRLKVDENEEDSAYPLSINNNGAIEAPPIIPHMAKRLSLRHTLPEPLNAVIPVIGTKTSNLRMDEQ